VPINIQIFVLRKTYCLHLRSTFYAVRDALFVYATLYW